MIRALVVMVIVAGLLTPIQSILLGGNPARAAQSDLTASLSAAGETVAPSSFTDLTTETFDSVNALTAGLALNIGTIGDLNSGTITAQSGGTYTSPTNTTYSISSTSRATDVAAWYGGSSGSGRFPYVGTSNASATVVGGMRITLNNIAGVSPADNTYRYVGFWWSGGNSPNIVRLMNDGVAQATFTTVNLLGQLGSAPSPRVSDDYFGNPNSTFNSDDATCPSGNNCSTVGQAEPYAYVNLRYSPGFDEIQFLGKGFEFDSISIRRYVPASDAGEVAIVGSGVVSSCSAFTNTNSQYVLRNGSFEDDFFTNAAGTTTESLASTTRWNSVWMNLSDADSGVANRIQFWKTTASDNQIELQRQVTGLEASAARNDSGYENTYFSRAADGDVYAEINANQQANLYQDIVTIGGEKITWSIKHRGRYFGSTSTSFNSSTASNDRDKFEIFIGPASGTLVSQTPSRKKLPDVIWNTTNATYSNNAFTTFTTNTTGHTAGTMYTRLEDGWVLYSGTYTVPTNQTSTRFSFNSRGTGSVGNLIDDIGFDPIMACPRSVTIQKSATGSFTYNPLTNSQIANYTYPDTTTLTSVSVNGGTGTATANTSTGDISLSSNTVGTFQVLYTLTDINNQTSTSTITVTVEDATAEFPNLLLVDPRANSVTLPSTAISGSTNAMVCYQQVANSSGAALSDSATLSVGRSSSTSGVALTETTNLWRITGARGSVQSQTSAITVSGLNDAALVTTSSKFLRIGLSAATAFGSNPCFLSTSRVLELKPLDIGAVVEREVELQ